MVRFFFFHIQEQIADFKSEMKVLPLMFLCYFYFIYLFYSSLRFDPIPFDLISGLKDKAVENHNEKPSFQRWFFSNFSLLIFCLILYKKDNLSNHCVGKT